MAGVHMHGPRRTNAPIEDADTANALDRRHATPTRYGVMPIRATWARPAIGGGTAPVRASATARCGSRGIDQLVEAQAVAPSGRTPRARSRRSSSASSTSAPRRPAHRRCAHGAHGGAGKGEHGRLAVERDHAHHHRTEAVGLAQGHLELGHGGERLRGVHARTAPQDRRASPMPSRPGPQDCRRGTRAERGTSRRR